MGSARRPWCRYGSSPTPSSTKHLHNVGHLSSWLCSEVLADRVVTQPLVPMPLRTAVVVPTLFEHRDADPSDPRATIWLVGRFTAEVYEAAGPGAPDPPGNLLREQLANTPDDVAVRQCLARHLLRILEDDAHHLSESRYLAMSI